MPADPPKATTQRTRRFKYGINTVVAVTAFVLLVALANLLAYNRLFKIRFDLTHTNRYTLSEQTQQVLADLEGDYQIITLLTGATQGMEEGNQTTMRFVDLYADNSDRITVTHVDPTQPEQTEALFNQLRERYSDELEPRLEAIDAGRTTLTEARDIALQASRLFEQIAADTQGLTTAQQRMLETLRQYFVRFDAEAQAIEEQLDSTMDDALPDYSRAIELIAATLEHFAASRLDVAMLQLNRLADQRSLTTDARNELLRLVKTLEQTRGRINDALPQLAAVQGESTYARVVAQLRSLNTVMLMGPDADQVRILQRDELLPRIPTEEEGEAATPFFLGEGRITGSLIAMTQPHQPMVVFVSLAGLTTIDASGRSAGAAYMYRYVAERLSLMNYDVRSWTPRLDQQVDPQTGRVIPPEMPPTPEPGQRVVWILTAMPAELAMRPDVQQMKQRAVEYVTKRFAQGDSVMALVGPSPSMTQGVSDPLLDLTREAGITPQIDRIVVKETLQGERGREYNHEFRVTQWPASPVSPAMAGLPARLSHYNIPLALDDEDDAHAIEILGQVRESQLMIHSDFDKEVRPRSPDNAIDTFVFAAASATPVEDDAAEDTVRMVVIGSPFWAADSVTMATQGELGNAAFANPGNTELFLNSVHWLAGMDALIAAGANTQEIRRVRQIPATQERALFWSLAAGLPSLILLAGVGMWLVRRRA